MRDRNERKIVNRVAYQLVNIFEDYYNDEVLDNDGLDRIINLVKGTPKDLRSFVFNRFLDWLDMRGIEYDDQFPLELRFG